MKSGKTNARQSWRRRADPGRRHAIREAEERTERWIEQREDARRPKSPRTQAMETRCALASYAMGDPLRAMLRGAGIPFTEDAYETGTRYFYIRDPFDADHREIIRVSDHRPKAGANYLASIHPGGATVEQVRALILAWLRGKERA